MRRIQRLVARRPDLEALDFNQEEHLIFGEPFLPGLGFRSSEEMKVAWDVHRERLLAAYPGVMRPFASWKFDLLPVYGGLKSGESKYDYLVRHGLLEPAEDAR